jgi:hypothetical protein
VTTQWDWSQRDRDLIPGRHRGFFFSLASISSLTPIQPPIQNGREWSEDYFPSCEVTSSWHWQTPSNAEVKNVWNFTSNLHTSSRRGASLRRWKNLTVTLLLKVPRGCIIKLCATKPDVKPFGDSKSSHLWMGSQVDRAGFVTYKYGNLDARKTSASQYRSLFLI